MFRGFFPLGLLLCQIDLEKIDLFLQPSLLSLVSGHLSGR
jgi:hypothetical protein